jgi:ribose-phosphate pyrophosphokinase
MVQPFSVLSTRSCVPYAKRVVQSINEIPERRLFPDVIDYTDTLSVTRFADGELEVTLNRSVRGRVVVLFTTCARNEAGLSVEECKIELYHTIDVLKRSQAKEILVFEPYISCSRSDRTTRRNSVGFWIHYKTLISLGCNHLITYQMHSDKSKTIFDPCLCSIDDVPAISILQKYLCETTIKSVEMFKTEVHDSWLFCSVDAGGEKLAKRFSSAFNTQLVIAHKQRNYAKPNEVESINLLSAVPLAGKTVWIVDDMIDTAGSVFNLVRELKEASGKPINIMIVHPVLSGPAIGRLNELKTEGSLGRLVVCDTVSCEVAVKELPFMEIIGSEPMSARIVLTIIQDYPMSDLCDAFSPEQFLSVRNAR